MTGADVSCGFYNWDRNICCLNSSPSYQVIAENVCGLLFKNKADRKVINVDPKVGKHSRQAMIGERYEPLMWRAYPGDNTTRTPVETDLYLQLVIYDHVLRRKL
ncbi:hypothetical protein EYD10_01812 [Varanus komodoensis]|nr:hypothetical protein EYD10_01812 [Varanus komodoensis]